MAVNGTPFNAPDNQPALIEMWRTIIGKAQQDIQPFPTLSGVIPICFSGGGVALAAGFPTMGIVTFPCRILGCWLFAGSELLTPVAVTATVDLRYGQQGAWSSGAVPIYGPTSPRLTAQSEASMDISGWALTDLAPGTLLPARLATFTGAATWILLALPVRRLDQTIDSSA